MKKYNVYYTLVKAGSKEITKYYFLDAVDEKDALSKATIKGKLWQSKGYLFNVKNAEVSQWFAI